MGDASPELEGLAKFACNTKYEDLPQKVVRDVKFFLMDSIGCGLAGVTTDPGKMFISLAKRLGGPPESSIIGVNGKVSCVNAVLANGQLINAIDYDSISGHTPPYIVPPPLALAESVKANGKQLILAIAIGLEIVTRVSRALTKGSFMNTKQEKFTWSERSGYASHNFGAAASAGKIIELDNTQMLNAMGTAGHLSQVLTWIRYTFQEHRAMTKYCVPGWQNTGGVMAALLAKEGFIGDTTIFDAEQGFWKFVGYETWNNEKILEGLGKEWAFFNKIIYKPYPSCRMFQTELDCFLKIINENHINPEEIESVLVLGHPTLEAPAFTNREVKSIVDVQFGPAYTFAMAAHRVPIGVEWQDLERVKSPEIKAFAEKITYRTYPEFLAKRMSIVEVKARGKIFKEEKEFVNLHELTEADLFTKFRHNASRILTDNKIEKAIKAMMELEKVKDVNEFTAYITL
jgi:2-methylcitrate dehydratase PrpD